MFKPCCQCAQQFEITDEDLKFYDKVSPVFAGKKYPIPEPTLCPDCRQQRRIAWRNEQKLYHRTCDLCKKTILAMYDADTKFPVYCLDCWYSDKWDPYDYGRQFDMKRPFFEQFADLLKVVPRFSMSVPRSTMENADYCNASGNLKNCYLIVNSDYSEQCYYGKGMNRCFQCVDCFKTYDCQNCYEVINSNNCYGSSYLLDSYNSENCHFSSNLKIGRAHV